MKSALYLLVLASAALPPASPAQALTPAPASVDLPQDASSGRAQRFETVSPARSTSPRPFRAVAISAKIGTGGLGFDVATPLASFMNVRGGVQMFEHTTVFTTDGLHADGVLTLQNISASVDLYPFRGAFRISPGVTIHNDNHLTTTLNVAGGQTFSLGDGTYTSATYDPIQGIARLHMGNLTVPRITMGWGNMLKPGGGHWSLPTEFGFEYTSRPTLSLILSGTACDSQGHCGDVNEAQGAADIAAEVVKLQNDLAPLRFYPILSTGISYRFGHVPSRVR